MYSLSFRVRIMLP